MLPFQFPVESTCWPTRDIRRVSVNSFGFGGTNAHAIIDDAYHYLNLRGLSGHHCTSVPDGTYHNGVAVNGYLESSLGNPKTETQISGSNDASEAQEYKQSFQNSPVRSMPKLLGLSANNEKTLKSISAQYERKFSARNIGSLELGHDYVNKLVYTLNERRTSFSWKSFCTLDCVGDLRNKGLKFSNPVRAISNPKLGFCFTGQGAQWFAMGRELFIYPMFLQSLESMDMNLKNLGCPWSLLGKCSCLRRLFILTWSR
jgi:acyl transferase domain-containing protein